MTACVMLASAFINNTPVVVILTGGAPVHAGAARYYRERGWLP